jgi:uncharacterized protein YhfF
MRFAPPRILNQQGKTMNSGMIEGYWQTYLATLPADHPHRTSRYVAEALGDTPNLASWLGALIVSGAKTGTCSALWEWEAEGKPIPEVGLKTIVLDGSDEPLCIIETMDVWIQPYDRVDSAFAAAEGEGDRSLDYWRQAHWNFFTRTLPRSGARQALTCRWSVSAFALCTPSSARADGNRAHSAHLTGTAAYQNLLSSETAASPVQ